MEIPPASAIRDARRDRGLTQSEVAESAGVSQPLLSRVENEGVDPRLSTLHAIATAINDHESKVDSNELDVAVPDALRDRRTKHGLTQSELADRAGVSQPLIARIESGDVDPRMSTMRSVLSALPNKRSKETDSDPDSNATPHSSDDILTEIEDAFDEI